MSPISRRHLIGAAVASGALASIPHRTRGQSDTRPSITVAVQKIANSNTLEPLREQSNVGTRTYNCTLEQLIDIDWVGDLSRRPGLATEWRRIDDRTVEAKLRQGVKFHNGDEMTAEDVAFSFGPERMWGTGGGDAANRTLFTTANVGTASKAPPPEVVAVAKRALTGFDKIEIVDKYTVRFVNKTPDVTLEGRLTRNVGVIGSRRAFAEAASWLDWARAPVGTGPYRVVEFKPDTLLQLEAFDEYWGGKPPIRQLRFVEVPELASRINGLLSGQYDFACDITPDQIAEVERNPKFEVLGGLILNTRLTVFDKTHPQLVNPLVRRAFTHAIDRKAIVDALWAGRTAIPKGLQWDIYGEMLIADWSVPAYDPDLAKKLLKEAGYKGDPIPYRLLNNYYTGQVSTAQILVEMWKAVGLNVEIQMKENWQQIFAKDQARGIRDWSASASFDDPVSSLLGTGNKGQNWQVGEYFNEEAAKLAEELETSTDHARRKAIHRRLLEICEREDPEYTVLHQTANFTAKRKNIEWKTGASFAMEFRSRNFRLRSA